MLLDMGADVEPKPQGEIEPAEAARSLARRLDGVSDPAMRSNLVREYCVASGAEAAVAGLEALVACAVRGERRGTWLSVAAALCRGGIPYDVLGDLYRAAVDGGHQAMRLLLIGGDVAKKLADDSEFSRDELIENLSLGERKAKARTLDKDLLDRLLFDPDASVIRVLLRNPRVTERDVIRLASRRPNRRDVLREIALVSRWLSRPGVQRALVLNPYTPVRVTVALLPLLGAQELHEVSRDRSLHRLAAATARVLLELRGWDAPVFH